eukprot:scaffold137976_cov36-Prasinocladus_malaysianus.AAC.1
MKGKERQGKGNGVQSCHATTAIIYLTNAHKHPSENIVLRNAHRWRRSDGQAGEPLGESGRG